MNRLGIELSPTICRIVAVRTRRVTRHSSSVIPTRVVAFHTFSYDNPESLTRQLRAILVIKRLPKKAWVTLWGLRSAHKFLQLPPAKPGDLEAIARREARRDLASLEATGDKISSGVTTGALRQTPGGPRRDALVIAASAADVQRRLQPLVDAGLHVEGVVTPALALGSVARLCATTPGAGLQAYVAIAREATAVTVVRDGMVHFVREIPWGYEAGSTSPEAFAAKLASELRRSFVFLKQTLKAEIAHVAVCGDVPELRSVGLLLFQALNVEFETLDVMQGIDATALPQPAEAFREQVAHLRLAWAMAADTSPPINLLPAELVAEREARRQAWTLGSGLAAAVVAGVLLLWNADATARDRDRQLQQLRDQLAMAEPRARARAMDDEQQTIERVRVQVLDAFDSQGPRLARVLEIVGLTVPPEIVLNTLSARTLGASWYVKIGGFAIAPDPALAQAAVNQYLGDLQTSPYFGAPLRAPSLRMRIGSEDDEQSGTETPMLALAPGMSGIEFFVEFEVRK